LAETPPIQVLATGIPNLDRVLGGGVPRQDVLLILGLAGTGKTTLVLQMLSNAARRGENVLYVSTVSEPPTKLFRHSRSFRFFDEALIGKRVFVLDAYPLIKQGLGAFGDALVTAVKQFRASVVAIDGLMSIHDLSPTVVDVRTFIYELGATLATLNCTTLVTSSGIAPTAEQQFPELTMTDGILRLETYSVGLQTFRRLHVQKVRGASPLLGQHSFQIDLSGVTVYPRLEAVFSSRNLGLQMERVATGMPELDALMSGGPRAGSVTLLAGTTGTGKTLAGLQFLMEGVRRGEKGLYVSFQETGQQLIDKARLFNIDLASAVESRRVGIFHRTPVDLNLDQISWEMLQEVERLGPTRLVFDNTIDIEQMLAAGRDARGYLTALTGTLEEKGITSVVVREVPGEVGAELDFSGSALAVLAENLILMRWIEYRGNMYHILSVLKMRNSRFEPGLRQYIINDQGLRVLGASESAEGLLTGIARLRGGFFRPPSER